MARPERSGLSREVDLVNLVVAERESNGNPPLLVSGINNNAISRKTDAGFEQRARLLAKDDLSLEQRVSLSSPCHEIHTLSSSQEHHEFQSPELSTLCYDGVSTTA